MANQPDITPELCRQLLRYDPETGRLFWKRREGVTERWNARFAGKEAFTASTRAGYKIGAIHRKLRYAHRVIYALYYGAWPDGEVDHLNGDPADNRIDNLRAVTSRENRMNTAKSSRNTSGFTGVVAMRDKWQAKAGSHASHSNVHLGTFDTREEAAAARAAYNSVAGYSARHGK